ncbi:uncharacterized protein LOC132611795 [Lycium barbarum]|uniref:uncharacterized protein LOC132611795 n=1 Tax=Lycium barbarum TaxID=112863 RepID=UPI00293ED769|nr:uncharacterized protein LOC132611795 [Lycium barbarum]
MVSNRGIKINLDKIKEIEDITMINDIKWVQRLTGRIAALSRFISKSSEKSHRFFSLLKKKTDFAWTPECQKALAELKKYLSSPPLLHTPKENEQLYLYLAVSEIAVSGVLVQEEEAQALQKVREKEVIDFIYDHIIYRFGIPAKIACDNGKQFIGSKVSKFFEEYNIKKILSTPYHPSANGQAESTNKIILQNLKERLTRSKHRWKEILPEVLWAYRTTAYIEMDIGSRETIDLGLKARAALFFPSIGFIPKWAFQQEF